MTDCRPSREQRVRVAIVTRTLAMAVSAMAALAWLSIGVIVDAEAVAQPGERYFIDFRARRSTYIGHTYIIYFRTDAAGRTLEDASRWPRSGRGCLERRVLADPRRNPQIQGRHALARDRRSIAAQLTAAEYQPGWPGGSHAQGERASMAC